MKVHLEFILLSILILACSGTISLAQSCSIFAGNDTTLCFIPDTLHLNAQPSQPLDPCSVVEWTPATGLSDPNILDPIAIVNSSITYHVTANISIGNNMVTNGDFEDGNTGFTNGYMYDCPFGGYLSEFRYCVTDDPQNVHLGATSCSDHTSGNGLMLVVNGGTTVNSNVWEETIAVSPNTYYMFSFWVTNWSSFTNLLPTFDINVNGISQGQSFSINSTQCLWKEDCLLWYSDASTSATFQIIDQVDYYGGNDFSIDDILLQEVCVATDSITISVGGVVSASFDTAACEGSTISMSASYGNTFQWSPTNGLSCNTCQTVSFVADSSITYYAYVTGNGCDYSDTFNISVDSLPLLLLPDDTFLCAGSSVQIDAQSSSTIIWSPSQFLSCDSCNNPLSTPISSITYIASVTNGTCVITDSIRLQVAQPPLISLAADTSVCFGVGLLLAVDSGYADYLWSPSNGLSCSTCFSTDANPDSTITYSIAVSDSGCSSIDSITVIVDKDDAVDAGKDDSLCVSGSVQLSATGSSTYVWSPSASLNDASISNPLATPATTTQYIVQGSDACGATSDTVVVFVLNPPVVTASYDSIIYCHAGTQITLTGEGEYSYEWLNPDVSDPSASSVFVNPDEESVYSVTVSNRACDTVLQFPVLVSNAEVTIPNAFSPNDDGINDFFYILHTCPITLDYFRIFNRWGELIFETNDIEGKWDGTYKNENCSVDVYVYVIYAHRISGENFIMKGNVTLVR